MKNIKRTVETTFLKLCNNPRSVCVALSGGADSICVLHILKELSHYYSFALSAVPVNHNIRGDEALRDAEFCIDLCNKLNVPLKIADVSVLTDANKGESVELAARRLRYEVFEQLEVQYIATAHNADDSLETFLINF